MSYPKMLEYSTGYNIAHNNAHMCPCAHPSLKHNTGRTQHWSQEEGWRRMTPPPDSGGLQFVMVLKPHGHFGDKGIVWHTFCGKIQKICSVGTLSLHLKSNHNQQREIWTSPWVNGSLMGIVIVLRAVSSTTLRTGRDRGA